MLSCGAEVSVLYLYVLAAILLRILPHPWNAAPIGAMFLFSGATFNRRLDSLLVPLAALMVSDYAVVHVLYGGRYAWFTPYTWAGFLLVGLIGWALRNRISVPSVALASLSGSVVFFLVTNFGVWTGGKMYPLTLTGLAACYTAGIPFFRNELIGDLIYAAIMFGSYAAIQHRRTAMLKA